jgi:hypothetical protein
VPIIGLPAPPPVDGVTYPPGWRFGPSLVDVGATTFGLCDAGGVEWHVGDLSGWDDTPGVVSTKTQRVGQHGAYGGPQVYAARELRLDGWIVARDMATRAAALRSLHRSAPINALIRVAVTDPTDPPVRFVWAKLDGSIKAARVGENVHAIQIPLWAEDPRKYGLNPDAATIGLPSFAGGLVLPLMIPVTLPVRVSGGSRVVVNAGDMAAPWTAVLTGPITTPRIHNLTTDRYVAFNLTLGDGDTLTIDSRERTAVLNGVADRAGLIVRGSSWWELPEGESEIRLGSSVLPTGGTPSLSFTALSAWA